MTNFILGTFATIIMTVAAFAFSDDNQETKKQLTESQQIEIYETVMDECVINK